MTGYQVVAKMEGGVVTPLEAPEFSSSKALLPGDVYEFEGRYWTLDPRRYGDSDVRQSREVTQEYLDACEKDYQETISHFMARTR